MAIISVILPTYNHSRFILRAVESLLAQTFSDWELWVIDDASPDNTPELLKAYLKDSRIHYHRFSQNEGLGKALNYGLNHATGRYVAYLPSDDLYYANHLAQLCACLDDNPGAILAFSGVRHHYNKPAHGQIDGYPLQLVQVLHRATPERWLERSQLVTDDLSQMLWERLQSHGEFVGSGQISCEWVDHPAQLHKIIREPVGGLNTYRSAFQVREPIRIHTTVGNFMDEEKHYQRFRSRSEAPPSADGLKILLVGELAYNPERILAFEERGHQLYGLWMPDPYWYNTVGPLPFGHVEDIAYQDWRSEVRRIQPDVIYALLNWQAVPFAHKILEENPGIPFVWHYKEGPFISLEKGHWNGLIDLHQRSNGQVYSSPEMRDWYETIVPGSVRNSQTLVLDGDLPKRDWLDELPSTRLSEKDGEIHTVVPGRPIGHHPQDVAELAEQGIHLHFYGDFTHGQWLAWIEKTRRLAPDHIHLHSQVDQEGWVREFSQYDAGWLHIFKSENFGELRKANWDDLNYPARIATLVAAGLPLLQFDNTGSIVAAQRLAAERKIGLFYRNKKALADQLRDERLMSRLRENVWNQRLDFTFDAHVDRLVEFFHQVIDSHSSKIKKGAVVESTSFNTSEIPPARSIRSKIVYESLPENPTD